MPNKKYIFPVAKQAEAEAYAAACNANWPGVPDLFTAVDVDAYGQWVVAALEPTFTWDYGDGNGQTPVAEPPACAAARVDGVLSDTWTPPEV